MELTLTLQSSTIVKMHCDGQLSHTFDLRSLAPDSQQPDHPPQPLEDPVAYGRAVYTALFPPDTLARKALDRGPERLLLIATDDPLDAIPWEYAHGLAETDDFLVLDMLFVRGLPANQRVAPSALNTGLHIVAVPSNPLDDNIPSLNIDGEWQRLMEIIQEVPVALTLERTRPPTLEQLRRQVSNQRHRVVHFMGHGGQTTQGAILCFEQDDGGLAVTTAKEFVRVVKGTVLLVTLNACVSATPGPTAFNNLAAALIRQKVPYTLGMRFSVLDDDARTLSRMLYSELARGVSVEAAVQHVRNALARGLHQWTVGVPVLYTALSDPALGFSAPSGTSQVIDRRPRLDIVPALPRAEGTFQGRIVELRAIGRFLTGDSRPRVLTIHGVGGQGKTVLAREVVERFAWAWPGGAVALSFESLPSREQFVGDLARFLGIDTSSLPDPTDVERQVLGLLGRQRTLIVLDNVETLVAAVEDGENEALRLAQLIREQLPGPQITLLVTSRTLLGWPGEEHVGMGGLDNPDGALLFRDSAPQRRHVIEMSLAEELSRKVAGHPFSLRLLGSAFNQCALPLAAFIAQHEEQLLAAENKYVGPDHRHRSLYASIDTSIRYLDDELRALLSGLWVFHAPFLSETAVAIFDPQERLEVDRSPVFDRLHALWRRSLLARQTVTTREGTLVFYRLLPTMRPYTERHLPQAHEREALLLRFGMVYAALARRIYTELDRSTADVIIAQTYREDLERGLVWAPAEQRGEYLLRWGWIAGRLGDRRRALRQTEQALEYLQGTDQQLELVALTNMAGVYGAIGQPQRALALYEQVLPIMREVGDRSGEAATFSNMAGVYGAMGQPQRALTLLEQALPIIRGVGDRSGEATGLNPSDRTTMSGCFSDLM